VDRAHCSTRECGVISSIGWLAAGLGLLALPRPALHPSRPTRHLVIGSASRPRLAILAAGAVTALGLSTWATSSGAVVAIAAGCAAGVATRWLPRRGPPGAVDRLPFALDLAAAVLRGGAPVSMALEHAAPGIGGPAAQTFIRAARLLRLGASPTEAWRVLEADPGLAALSAVCRRSATSGVRLAAAWEQLAVDLRADRRAVALARAHRAGVFAMAPLGLCFLPAFVCLGVIPDVVGIARGVLPAGP
jgi:Flp pilus assembly protein TadB